MTSHSSAVVAGLVCLSAAVVMQVPMPWLATGVTGESSIGRPGGCNTSCGGVDIPFPFGIGDGCWLLPGFEIMCKDTGNGVLKPFMVLQENATAPKVAAAEVLSISLKEAEAKVLRPIYSKCYDTASQKMLSVPGEPDQWYWDLGNNTPYSFSRWANKFTVLGCRTLAYISDDSYYLTGCLSTCFDGNMFLNPCSGNGCCQTPFAPMSLNYYTVDIQEVQTNMTTADIYGRCSFAVLMDSWCHFTLPNSSSNRSFSLEFSASIRCSGAGGGKAPVVSTAALRGGKAPVVLGWSIGDDDCKTAPTKPGYACVSPNSSCSNAYPYNGRGGYICTCDKGFDGNPYLHNGCQDIDECIEKEKHDCFGDCKNTIGSFHCTCPSGFRGNATIPQNCQKDRSFPRGALITVGIVAGLLVALIAILSIKVFLNKENKKRQRYFEQHGGRMLSRILETDGNVTFKLYERGDLVKATHGFHKANIVGEGAHGTVYKATLGTATVAVKQCKQIDKTRTDEFVQELVVLCRVSHPNVVRLLGCCLHFEAPMLVYEFVPNGTLSDLLYGRPKRLVTLPTRLRIAAETTEALAYLHLPPHPTLHGDVKPQNILLDKGYVAKVSDFGCSTINDNVQVVPKGTLAYLDPEFLQDFQITDKTDVYSFGVVLIELLTGKNPQAKEWKNLTTMFQNSMGNGTLGDLLDADIVEEGSMGLIYAVAKLVTRCIAVPGNARPAMGQVAVELRRFSDEMPDSAEARAALEVEDDGSSYTATEGQTTTGFSNLPALSTEIAR